MSLRELDCTTCRYGEEYDEDHVRCRRYPPGGDYMDIPGKTEKRRGFPIITKGTWCGEHHFRYRSDLEL